MFYKIEEIVCLIARKNVNLIEWGGTSAFRGGKEAVGVEVL